MGTSIRIKPVQPTVIKDKAIVEQIIKEIRRRPTEAQLAEMEAQDERLMKMFKR